jgi:hypothetical protein
MKGKFFTIFLVSAISLIGCSEKIWVKADNNTMDNFKINENGPHISQGESIIVMTLDPNVPSGSFNLCRNYGCLAKVTVTATEFPQTTEPYGHETSVSITENPRDTFHVGGVGSWITASITPLNN